MVDLESGALDGPTTHNQNFKNEDTGSETEKLDAPGKFQDLKKEFQEIKKEFKERFTRESEGAKKRKSLRQRLKGEGKTIPSVGRSLRNMALQSPLNVLFVCIPLSWAAHFVSEPTFSYEVQFARECLL